VPGEVKMENQKSKMVAGLLGIFLGAFGVHKFYLGYTKEAVIMLVISLLSLGTLAAIVELIGFIEGIIYITKSDEDFQAIYVDGHKGWF